MSAADIKQWDIMWSDAQMLAVWLDPVSGKKIEAPIYITPDGHFRVQMPYFRLRGPGLPDGVQSTNSYGLDDPSLTPEQILRMSIRYASQRGDLAAIATLASSLHQVIGGSK